MSRLKVLNILPIYRTTVESESRHTSSSLLRTTSTFFEGKEYLRMLHIEED